MLHLAGNLLCAIDTETTGIDPYEASIWQFACIPLDNFIEPHKEHGPFEMMLQPESQHHESAAITERQFINATNHGVHPDIAADVFDEWFNRLNLPIKKKIIVLAHNWVFDQPFIRAWLGDAAMNHYFYPVYRDTMSLAGVLCDSANQHADHPPFDHQNLRHVAQRLDIEWEDGMAHTAIYDAYKTAEVYRRLLHRIRFN